MELGGDVAFGGGKQKQSGSLRRIGVLDPEGLLILSLRVPGEGGAFDRISGAAQHGKGKEEERDLTETDHTWLFRVIGGFVQL